MSRLTERTPEQAARDRELARLRAAAFREANPGHNKEYLDKNRAKIMAQKRARYEADSDARIKPFIGWDGEGYNVFTGYTDSPPVVDHRYMLFGCSFYPDNPVIARSLSTRQCLDYILYVESQCPDASHISFAFDYDVNMILTDLETRHLRHLADYGSVHWQGYRIAYQPGRSFTVTKGRDDEKISATIDDMFHFFNCKYTTALLKFGVADQVIISRIEEGKGNRGRFRFDQIDYVLKYWQDEISLFPALADCIRESCYDAGFYIRRWYGPGVLSSYLLRQHKVHEWKSKNVPPEVQIATQTAFAGGRFHPWQCGLWYHDIYTADINSAYVYACSLLPRLDNGEWKRQVPVDRSKIARFGLYRIRYDNGVKGLREARENGKCAPIFPLFNRSKNGVSWPARTEGWYWSPEAELVKDDPDATFLEAWTFDDDGTYPFGWVADAFDKRLLLQRLGNPAEKTFKWALASLYGKFAQTVGWDKKTRQPPHSHELAWAGFITSWCRAEMYKVGLECWKRGGLISIDTDGVTSSVPFEAEWLGRGIGDGLGQWKLEKFSGILYWQTGLFWMLDADGNWTTAKTRGFKRGSLDINAAFVALDLAVLRVCKTYKQPVLVKRGTRFTGFKDALNRNAMNEWQQWKELTQEATMGKGSASYHNGLRCPKCRDPELDQMHYLTPVARSLNALSEPRQLPWLEEQPYLPEIILDLSDMAMTGKDDIIYDTDLADYL